MRKCCADASNKPHDPLDSPAAIANGATIRSVACFRCKPLMRLGVGFDELEEYIPWYMPIYEYKCRNCGQQFEKLVKLSDKPDCPSCESSDLERLISPPVVSTAKTRARSASSARRSAESVRTEKKHAQAEYERNYVKDHPD